MKNEKPILFSGPMINAILQGRKTQTRRIAKLFNERESVKMGYHNDFAKQFDPRFEDGVWKAAYKGYECACPYGKTGDQLWVRETWNIDDYYAGGGKESPLHSIPKVMPNSGCYLRFKANCAGTLFKHWRPSIHMPRWASRITLEITDIRVERLQDISEEDALSEGIKVLNVGLGDYFWDYLNGESRSPLLFDAIDSYATLWESINGEGSWDKNPWVWVISFRRI